MHPKLKPDAKRSNRCIQSQPDPNLICSLRDTLQFTMQMKKAGRFAGLFAFGF